MIYVKDTRTGYKVPLIQGDDAVTAHEAASNPHPQYITDLGNDEIRINLHNNGSEITTGLGAAFYTASSPSTIIGWYINAYPTGSISLDILKRTTGIPNASHSITNGNYVNVSSSQQNSSTNLSGWSSTSIVQGNTLGINILSATNVKYVVVTLKVDK